MKKVLLAVGDRDLEQYLQAKLKIEFSFAEPVLYKEAIIKSVNISGPDIFVIRETLPGSENILSIIYELRASFSQMRIVYLAGERQPGDELLEALVNCGVYDILAGGRLVANDIINLIRIPNRYNDVRHLQRMPVFNDVNNRVVFKAPESFQTPSAAPGQDQVAVPAQVPAAEPAPTQSPAVKDEPKIPEPKPDPAPAKKLVEDKKRKPSGESDLSLQPKIITFLGGKHGVGTTSVALNTAAVLAQRGKKVIFVEFDENSPSAAYWYELGIPDKGIDTALLGIETERFDEIEKAIIKTVDLKKLTGSDLLQNYSKFPSTLDFMFFSNNHINREWLTNIQIPFSPSLTRELFMYLLFQMDYDFVVLDMPPDINTECVKNALLYSGKTFLTFTQDVSSIGYAVQKLHELAKLGINVDKKLVCLLNKFEPANLTVKEIQDWIKKESIVVVPQEGKEFINSSFIGVPVSLATKNIQLKNAFSNIIKNI